MKINPGTKIVIPSFASIKTEVKSVKTLDDKRVELVIDWDGYGDSRVYMHDYRKTWYLKSEVN